MTNQTCDYKPLDLKFNMNQFSKARTGKVIFYMGGIYLMTSYEVLYTQIPLHFIFFEIEIVRSATHIIISAKQVFRSDILSGQI